jgi:hypothetical protein
MYPRFYHLATLLILIIVEHTLAQTEASAPVFRVRPYLQDAAPEAITIMWETSEGEESVVEWGLSPQLGNTSTGLSFSVNQSGSRIHEVNLRGLQRLSLYYYRVKTGELTSDIYQFKTPPFARDKRPINFVAMSDMQHDGDNPGKFAEIVEEGVLSYLHETYQGVIPENLALVMIPGDLVTEGTQYYQWKEHFFDAAHPLFAQVPVYPVPGNHEQNSTFFFKYFSLPNNGSPAYEEHWWYKDYGNIRIIGLDSNEGYRNKLQLDWLDEVLQKTTLDDSIDFVFAQLHHPFKSEVWLDGELDFTGEVVKKLEHFSSASGKPSVHFFGHTHAYSRGQSRDHKHLWINVATAGGNIDYWGEFAQRNYEEFTVSQDEYGFVMVEVDPNQGDPRLTIKRISMGNEHLVRNKQVRDSVTVWKFDKKPRAPRVLSPVNKTVPHDQVFLRANAFKSSRVGAEHGASHWQVSETKDFETLLVDSWKQYEDWYVYQNLQEGDDLTDEKVKRLDRGKTYYWRVRYRDKNLNWSDWSAVASFETAGTKVRHKVE